MCRDERASNDSAVATVVDDIISAVAKDGDAAVRLHSARLDGWEPQSFRLTQSEIAASLERVPTQVQDDIAFCQEQVRAFAEAQRATMVDLEVETLPGVRLGHRHIPVASVGAGTRWSPPPI
jgi:sulfopropanediol 3-dehydrogenase